MVNVTVGPNTAFFRHCCKVYETGETFQLDAWAAGMWKERGVLV